MFCFILLLDIYETCHISLVSNILLFVENSDYSMTSHEFQTIIHKERAQ